MQRPHGGLDVGLLATTHEIRIDDVLIISMLTPSSESASNILAATPGFVFMPAPTSVTRRDPGVMR